MKSTGHSRKWRRKAGPPSIAKGSATSVSGSCGTSRCATRGQSHELAVECPSGTLIGDDLDALRRRFHVEHDRAYGHGYPDEATGMVNFRLAALGSIAKPRLKEIEPASGPASEARKGTRPVGSGTAERFVTTPVCDRSRLAAEHRFEGPAIVEEMGSTTLVLPGYAATVVRFANLLVSPADECA